LNLSSPTAPKVLGGSVLLVFIAASAAALFMHHGSQAPPRQGDSGCTTKECGSADTTPSRPPVRRAVNAYQQGLISGRGGYEISQTFTNHDPTAFCPTQAHQFGNRYPDDASAGSLFLQGCLQGANGG
jgi:hypothetical protein